ncbi:MAG: GNAT family N-acetyltransferase [Pseudomonadota bacterium]
MTAALQLPSPELEESYRSYIEELGDEERYPFPLDFAYDDFLAWLRRVEAFAAGVDLPEGFVSSTTFWLVRDEEIIGVSNLRHTLNAGLAHCGGHIGLGVRPSWRGNGVGNRLMALTIQEARKRGIGAVHVHCHKHNIASARMIVGNGGVLDSEIEDGEPPEIVQRYVIPAP